MLIRKENPIDIQIWDYVSRMEDIDKFDGSHNIELWIGKDTIQIDYKFEHEKCHITNIWNEEEILADNEVKKICTLFKNEMEQRYAELKENEQEYDVWNEHGFSSSYDYYKFRF